MRRGGAGVVWRWGGLGVCVCVMVAWVGSAFWYFEWRVGVGGRAVAMVLSNGQAGVLVYSPIYGTVPGSGMIDWPHRRPALMWRPGRLIWFIPMGQPYSMVGAAVNLWIVLLVCCAVTWAGWRRHALRAPDGHCVRCGYDLRGGVGGVCPECGAGAGKKEFQI